MLLYRPRLELRQVSMNKVGSNEEIQGMDSNSMKKLPPNLYQDKDSDEVSLLGILTVILRFRHVVVLMPALLFILLVGSTLLKERKYSAFASFVPETSEAGISLSSSLAAQFGIGVPSGTPGQSSAFYADLAKSREILQAVVENIFSINTDAGKLDGNLIDIFSARGITHEEQLEGTIKKLKEAMSVNIERETGVVTISVTSRWASLSTQINQRILDLLNLFNLERRQTRAGIEREFISERMGEVKSELRESEDLLQEFLQQNRQFAESPELNFVHDRLQREVVMRQTVVTSLAQAYEQARIDEVRDTPVITIVERPNMPVFSDSKHLIITGILAVIAGLMLGIFFAFGYELVRKGKEENIGEFDQFYILKKRTLEDLRRPWKLFKKPSTEI